MAKDHAISMTEQTGVQLSLTEHDMKQYLSSVLKEIKVLQNVDEILRERKRNSGELYRVFSLFKI